MNYLLDQKVVNFLSLTDYVCMPKMYVCMPEIKSINIIIIIFRMKYCLTSILIYAQTMPH